MRRARSAVCALLACFASLTSLPAATASAGRHAPTTTASMSSTAAENRAAAEAAAASLLTQFPLPPGSTPSATEPGNDDSLLAKPPLPRPQTPNLVDDSAWSIVSETPSAALVYIRGHLPAGTLVLTAWSPGGSNIPANETAVFILPTSGGGLGQPPARSYRRPATRRDDRTASRRRGRVGNAACGIGGRPLGRSRPEDRRRTSPQPPGDSCLPRTHPVRETFAEG